MTPVPYYFDGKRVSRQWLRVLRRARHEGVRFTLNSGRRTMSEQWALWRSQGQWSPTNPHGAARPSPFAPHIRVGRCDHALDIRYDDGGAQRFDVWCTKKGFPLDQTVPPEPWHREISGGDRALRRFYKHLGRR